eukprot:986292_1
MNQNQVNNAVGSSLSDEETFSLDNSERLSPNYLRTQHFESGADRPLDHGLIQSPDSNNVSSQDSALVDSINSDTVRSLVSDISGAVPPLDSGILSPLDSDIALSLDSDMVASLDSDDAPSLNSGIVSPLYSDSLQYLNSDMVSSLNSGSLPSLDSGTLSPQNNGAVKSLDSGQILYSLDSGTVPSLDSDIVPALGGGTVPSLVSLILREVVAHIDRFSGFGQLPEFISKRLFSMLESTGGLTQSRLAKFDGIYIDELKLANGGSWLESLHNIRVRSLSLHAANGVTDYSFIALCGKSAPSSPQLRPSSRSPQLRPSSRSPKLRPAQAPALPAPLTETLAELRVRACLCLTARGLLCVQNFRALRVIELADMDCVSNSVLHAISCLPNVERLKLQNCPKISFNGVSSCFESLTSLTYVHLEQCPKVSSDGFKNIGSLTRLSTLILRSLSRLSDSFLNYLSGLSSLRKLDLYDLKLTDAGFAHLTGLNRLQHLCISYTRCQDFVEYLPESCPGLTELHITMCREISAGSLERALPNLTNLRRLKMRKVNVLTSHLVDKLLVLSNLECLNITA